MTRCHPRQPHHRPQQDDPHICQAHRVPKKRLIDCLRSTDSPLSRLGVSVGEGEGTDEDEADVLCGVNMAVSCASCARSASCVSTDRMRINTSSWPTSGACSSGTTVCVADVAMLRNAMSSPVLLTKTLCTGGTSPDVYMYVCVVCVHVRV